jgi:hypothetical protein
MTRQTLIEFKGIEFEVEFDYQESEAPDHSEGYPGFQEEVKHIYSIKHKDTDFLGLLEDYIKQIDQLILDSL